MNKPMPRRALVKIPPPVQTFTTQQVADLLGVTKRCLLNWLRDDKVPEPERDRNDHRVWTQEALSRALAYKAERRQPQRWGQHAKDRHPEPQGRDG
jgi:hypothetical protein